MKKPLPVPTPDTRPFWNGLNEGRVMLRHCRECDTLFHYPRTVCPGCLSSDLDWRQARGSATLYTYTISRRPTHPLFADEVPQYLAVVELDEGPRLTSTLVNVPEANIRIGMPLEPVFEHHAKERITLLRFQPMQAELRGVSAPATEPVQPQSLLTDESLAWIGRSGPPITGYPVTVEEIRRFCFATDDLNPRWLDPAATPGGIAAPPAFLSIPFDTEVPLDELDEDGVPLEQRGLVFPPLKARRKLFGGYQVEYFQPIRPGDVLTRQRRILDIHERQGASGSSVFVLIEATYTNQRGEKVAVETNTIVNR
ncbi:MAG TPA: MaoC family dehydratase N-terminal domain-containing protein [Pseudomonadales bacterium]|nr:MaoC family dehydratase N-terminal domain-containing protein [Pseudomonadales bacterium]